MKKIFIVILIVVIILLLLFLIPKELRVYFTIFFIVYTLFMIIFAYKKRKKIDWEYTRKWTAIIGFISLIDVSLTTYGFKINPKFIDFEINEIPVFLYNNLGVFGSFIGWIFNVVVIMAFVSLISGHWKDEKFLSHIFIFIFGLVIINNLFIIFG